MPGAYPPGPQPPPAIGAITGAYRLRVVLVLLSLLVFLALYLGLVVGAGWLVVACLQSLGDRGGAWIKLGAAAGAAMLFLFLLKGLFKRQRMSTDRMVELREEDQPELFAFLRRLCADAGSPLPGKVFVSHDVNAGVFYPRSLLALMFPVRKNLVIGLGLVNALGLSEFKAVLAHEFGHFAQSSMKLGQYVYVANQVIADMVLGRDGWDRFLRQWQRIDLRLSFPAWALAGIVWVLRKILGLAFQGINVLNLSLSRQMEFDADLCAVRLAGSDALISGLWKTERASVAYQLAQGELAGIAHHGKYSDDFFHHHGKSLNRLDRTLRRDKSMRERFAVLLARYQPGEGIHFAESGESASSMWATHPSNRDREVNAKRAYVSAPIDERPAWSLLEKPRALRRRLTRTVYEAMGKPVSGKPTPAAEVHALIAEERDEMEQAAHYHGLYDDRIVAPGDIEAQSQELDGSETEMLDALRAAALKHTGKRLARRMARHAELGGELGLLSALESGQLKPKKRTFPFRGKRRLPSEVPALLAEVRGEHEKSSGRLAAADRALFRYFYARSAAEPDRRTELWERYTFLLELQKHLVVLNGVERSLQPIMTLLQSGESLTPQALASVTAGFQRGRSELLRAVKACGELTLPKLAHLEGGTSAREFVLRERVIEALEGQITADWINGFLRQLGEALSRLRRLHFKNLGALLALQEALDPELFREPASTPASS